MELVLRGAMAEAHPQGYQQGDPWFSVPSLLLTCWIQGHQASVSLLILMVKINAPSTSISFHCACGIPFVSDQEVRWCNDSISRICRQRDWFIRSTSFVNWNK